jgi:iron complex outermembrane recepter protein
MHKYSTLFGRFSFCLSRMMNTFNVISINTGVIGCLLFSQQTLAQSAGEREVEELLVTAERREASLQSTAIAVSALDQEIITENDISNVTDLTGMVPGLVVSGQEDQSDIRIYIRGVGTNNPTETGDQGVGVYVDGVFAARAQGALALMYDLENVQVLRGPQGTLFGRNNTGGAVLLQTKKPGDTFEGNMQFTLGSYNRQQMSGGVSLPIFDTLSVRLAGYSDQDDGWVDPLSTDPRGTQGNYSGISIGRSANLGVKLNNTDVRSARLSAAWDIVDSLKWFLSYENFTDTGNTGLLLNPVAVERGDFGAFVDSPVALDMTSDVWRSSLSMDAFDQINIEYLLGVASLHRSQVVDQDAGVTSRFQEGRTEYQHSDSTSHEIKIQNLNIDKFSWTAGFYYFEEETDIRFDFDGQGAWLQGGNSFIQPARGAESEAVYAQATYHLTEQWSLTAGARYTDDLKYDRGGRNVQDCQNEFIRPTLGGADLSVFEDFRNNITGTEGADGLDDYTGRERVRGQCAATLRNDLERESDQTTYFSRVSYEIDDHLFYGSVGTGYRAGVIQDGGQSTEPENSISYELGSKSDFGNLRVNLAGFFIDYTDLIRSGFDEERQQIVNSNVAAAEIYGLELEVVWLVGSAGRFDFAGSYLNAEYKDYVVDNGGSGTNNPEILDENGEGTGLYDLAGNSLPQAPEFQFAAGFRWNFTDSYGEIVPRITVRYTDDVYFNDQNENRATINNVINNQQQTGFVYGNPAGQDAYTKVDLGIVYKSPHDDWSVDFFINNATDEMTRSSVSLDNVTAGGFPGRYASPRTLGIRYSNKF